MSLSFEFNSVSISLFLPCICFCHPLLQPWVWTMAKQERWEFLWEKSGPTRKFASISPRIHLFEYYNSNYFVKMEIEYIHRNARTKWPRWPSPQAILSVHLYPCHIFVSWIHMFRSGFVCKTNLMSTKCVRSYGGVSTTRHTVHSDNGTHHSTTMLKFKSNRNVSFSSAQSSRCLLIVLIAINNRLRCESEWEWNMAIKFNIARPAWPSSFWVSHGMSKKPQTEKV